MNLPAEYQLGPRALELLKTHVPASRVARPTKRPRTIIVPKDLALVYDGKTWRLCEPPPEWWLVMTEPEVADAPESFPSPAGTGLLTTRQTSCRPGRGPCRRHHVHASPRRHVLAVPGC